MHTFFTVLAWTSLVVSAIPNIINLLIFVLGVIVTALGDKSAFNGFRLDWRFFVWLAMGVWPIVFFIVT